MNTFNAYNNRLSYEDLQSLREEAISEDADLQSGEWMQDWEVIESHIRSGDFAVSKMVAELIVAAYRAPRSQARVRTMEVLAELFVQEVKDSLFAAAKKELERKVS